LIKSYGQQTLVDKFPLTFISSCY